MNNLPFFSAKELKELRLTASELIDCIEHLIRCREKSTAWNAPKSTIAIGDGRLFIAMLAVATDPPFATVKSLGFNPENVKKGLPSIGALITLLDSNTGMPVAVMDGAWITAFRTAGLSGIAAKRLAQPDSSVIAFIGCGVQANSHLQVFTELFPLKEIRAFGRGSKNRDALCMLAEKKGLVAVASLNAEDAITDADIIVTSVPESPNLKPFLNSHWLKPGSFVTMVDIGRSWITESMDFFDCIVIDDLEQESKMPIPMVKLKYITGDLTYLINGCTIGRCAKNERIAFMFRGLALGDLALSALAYQRNLGRSS